MCDIMGGLLCVRRDRHTEYLDMGWHSCSAVGSGAGILLDRREFGVPASDERFLTNWGEAGLVMESRWLRWPQTLLVELQTDVWHGYGAERFVIMGSWGYREG